MIEHLEKWRGWITFAFALLTGSIAAIRYYKEYPDDVEKVKNALFQFLIIGIGVAIVGTIAFRLTHFIYRKIAERRKQISSLNQRISDLESQLNKRIEENKRVRQRPPTFLYSRGERFDLI